MIDILSVQMDRGWAIICSAPTLTQCAVWLFPDGEAEYHFARLDEYGHMWPAVLDGCSGIHCGDDMDYDFISPMCLIDIALEHEADWCRRLTTPPPTPHSIDDFESSSDDELLEWRLNVCRRVVDMTGRVVLTMRSPMTSPESDSSDDEPLSSRPRYR
jgi:hypothetical protein